MVRLLMSKRSHAQFAAGLAALPVPVETILMDDAGALWEGDRRVEPAAARPDVVWLTLEAVMANQFNALLALIPQCGTVKFVQTTSSGLDAPGYPAILKAGIRLANSNAQSISIAEYVVGHVLGEWQRLPDLGALQASRQWKKLPLRELSQSSWLIIGFGNIGREVARRAGAFGADIVGVRSRRGQDDLAREIAAPEDLPRLLPKADVVVLACPLTKQTENLADAAFFGAMKPDSVLVNVARGKIVQDAALLAALDAGRPALAILDAFIEEPLPPDSPYWVHPRVRVTSHTSSWGNGTVIRRTRLFLDNLLSYARGEKLRNEVKELP